jgi:hypothetical protein
MTPEMMAKYGGRLANTYQFPLRTITGARVGFVIVNADNGDVQYIPSPETPVTPQIIKVEGGEWPVIAPAKPKYVRHMVRLLLSPNQHRLPYHSRKNVGVFHC